MNETPEANNHYNCPIVTSYAENIKNNMEELKDDKITFIRPFVALDNEQALVERLHREMKKNTTMLQPMRSHLLSALHMKKQKK